MDGTGEQENSNNRYHDDKKQKRIKEWLMIDHRIAPEKDPKDQDERKGKQ